MCNLSAQQRYAFNKLTPNEGLSQASNDYIYHDSKGFVWLSSLDGLNRFDGKSVTVYKSISGDSTSLLGNIITSNFFEDSTSNIWFTTYEGVHCYLRKKDHFLRFQLKDEKGERLQQDYRAFHLNKNKLWLRIGIGDQGRLHRFDLASYTTEVVGRLDGHRNFPVTDSTGKVLLVVSSVFDDRYGMEAIAPFQPEVGSITFPELESETTQTIINHVNLTDETTWYLSSSAGFLSFTPQTGGSQLVDTFRSKPIGNVTASLAIDASTLWVTTEKQGLLVFDIRKQTFTDQVPKLTTSKMGLPASPLNRLWKDRDNNVWITSREGVAYTNLDKKKFEFPPEFEGLNITAIFESSQGDVFCSYGSNQTAYFPGGKDKFHKVLTVSPPEQPSGTIAFFFETKDADLWAVSGSNLLRWVPLSRQFEYVQPIPGYILYCYKSPTDEVLLATFRGIYRCVLRSDKSGFQINPFTEIGEHQSALATAIFQDKRGRLYLSLDASRLLILAKKGSEYSIQKEITGVGYAKAFLEEKSDLWVATTTGLLTIDPDNLTSRVLNQAEDGIHQETFYSVLKSGEALWLSSNRGITSYNPTAKRFDTYTLADGLQGNEYNTNAYLKSSSGELWLGGTNGLNRFNPATIKPVPHLPQIAITRILVNDEPVTTSPQVGEVKELNLPYHQNTLSFNFVALEYSDPGNNRYQYKLDNLEDIWVDSGTEGFARYSNLSPGNYTFRVKGANADGLWSIEDRTLAINITPPWWQKWWFYLSIILAVSLIIYGAFFYQLQQALKLERLRVKISSDLHDDVGGILSGLAMQSELLSLSAGKENHIKLTRISQLSRSAMSRMRDTVWAIDARRDKLEDLIERMKEHAEEILTPKNIRYTIEHEQLSLKQNLATDVRQSLYLIYKEAITNVGKHSDGNEVHVRLKQSPRGFIMTIQDNGHVKEKQYETTGLGQSNMQMRAQSIGATLDIDVEAGFRITVRRKSI